MNTDATGDLFFVIGVMVVLFFVWLAVGGPNREESNYPFLTNPSPEVNFTQGVGGEDRFVAGDGSSEYYGRGLFGGRLDLSFGSSDESFESTSPYGSIVRFVHGPTGAQYLSPEREYLAVEVLPTSKRSVTLTGWRVRSTESGTEVVVPPASTLPYTGRVNDENPASIAPGARVYLVTGESPIGSSFRVNQCSGYFEQFQDYHPPLYQNCPLLTESLEITEASIAKYGASCLEYVARVPRCELVLEQLPRPFNDSCRALIQEELTYRGCIDRYKERADFYEPEWRLFLGLNTDLWDNEHDTIELLDPEGIVVDRLQY